MTDDGASMESDYDLACTLSGLTRNAVYGRFAIAVTVHIELIASINTSSVNVALALLRHRRRECVLYLMHGYARARSLGVDNATTAQHLPFRANVLSAMHSIRIGRGVARSHSRIP
jgi:hypothetical protein